MAYNELTLQELSKNTSSVQNIFNPSTISTTSQVHCSILQYYIVTKCAWLWVHGSVSSCILSTVSMKVMLLTFFLILSLKELQDPHATKHNVAI